MPYVTDETFFINIDIEQGTAAAQGQCNLRLPSKMLIY